MERTKVQIITYYTSSHSLLHHCCSLLSLQKLRRCHLAAPPGGGDLVPFHSCLELQIDKVYGQRSTSLVVTIVHSLILDLDGVWVKVTFYDDYAPR